MEEQASSSPLKVSHDSFVFRDRVDDTQSSENERRGKIRFPLVFNIRYRGLNKRGPEISGNGTTVNISSSGVYFSFSPGEQIVRPGLRMQLELAWPIALNDKCGLNLVVIGRVVRCGYGWSVVATQTEHFKTTALPVRVASKPLAKAAP